MAFNPLKRRKLSPFNKSDEHTLALVSRGLVDKEIAAEEGITLGAVKVRLCLIREKLGFAANEVNRVALAASWHREIIMREVLSADWRENAKRERLERLGVDGL